MGAKADALMQAIHGTDVYTGLDPVLPTDLQGWNSSHPVFNEIVLNDHPSVIFDVGVWKGGSTISLANLIRENGDDGVIVAIDTFLGSPEHWNQQWDNFQKNGRPLLYEQFLSNVLRAGLQDLVVPLPQSSENAAVILTNRGISAKLIHIDAAHEYDSVMRDIKLYWSLLEPGGCLIGDDYLAMWPGVVRAADEFAESIRQPLIISHPKWLIKKL